MSGEDGKEHFGKYEPDFFDLVIIRCHRGGSKDKHMARHPQSLLWCRASRSHGNAKAD